MVAYDLSKSEAIWHCKKFEECKGHKEAANRCLNPNMRNSWTKEYADDKLVGWIHIKLSKPVIMNGFSITSSNDVQICGDITDK